ncbi:acyl carrier protein [Streptomyces sp. ICBB 8177]|uniref:acyl carrier protein n=1 Tax=Streptomyces sp. ICBB 8177 TaxID=563922 RepID=UPI0018EEC950|nr:acyl carrier protein [Streptomyces sp. ICBB 8177]
MNSQLTYEELSGLMKSSAGVRVEQAALERDPETPFAEYGLDSLGLLGIIGELENRRGTSIAGDVDGCKTPHAFVEAVNASLTKGS